MRELADRHPRITMTIEIDLSPECSSVEAVRRAFELAAIKAVEATRDNVSEMKSARIGSYQLHSSVSEMNTFNNIPVPRVPTRTH